MEIMYIFSLTIIERIYIIHFCHIVSTCFTLRFLWIHINALFRFVFIVVFSGRGICSYDYHNRAEN